MPPGNTLYYGDNLDVLRQHIATESVDLIYLDPPFNSNANYNVLFAEQDGSRAAAQVLAFEDTWHWDQGAVAAYEEAVEQGGRLADALNAMHTFLGGSDMLAYLSMMAPRLTELRRVLKPTGSIYLHCDPTASHYLKMLMDAVFGPRCFQNEVVWYYKGAGVSPRRWGRRHDILLWYSKSQEWFFDPDPVRDEYAETTKERFSHHIGNVRGTIDYGSQSLNPKGKHPDDVWQIPIVAPSARERLYPTQKPVALLERVILSSSKPDDVILDPFCGCGTAVIAAQKLDRRWADIDITHLAINLIKHRLTDTYGPDVSFNVIGEPTDLAGAMQLAAEDPYQFQWWALGLVGARPVEQKKGADKGIDGRLFFHDEQGGKSKQVILSVKAGHITVSQLRDLRGVIERDHAAIGVLLSMETPTRPMRTEAADAGFYEAPWGQKYPRLQMLTIADLLDGRTIDMPPMGTMAKNVTHRRAPRQGVESRKDGGVKAEDPTLFEPDS